MAATSPATPNSQKPELINKNWKAESALLLIFYAAIVCLLVFVPGATKEVSRVLDLTFQDISNHYVRYIFLAGAVMTFGYLIIKWRKENHDLNQLSQESDQAQIDFEELQRTLPQPRGQTAKEVAALIKDEEGSQLDEEGSRLA